MLSRRHGTKRVRASLVYNEFIAHKTHTHMNSTQWETLTSFVLYMGKVGRPSRLFFVFVFVFVFFVPTANRFFLIVQAAVRIASRTHKTCST